MARDDYDDEQSSGSAEPVRETAPLPSTSMPPRSTPPLWICGYDEVPLVMRQASRTSSVRYLISIGDPGEPLPNAFREIRYQLRLEFHDVRQSEQGYIAPRASHIRSALRFARLLVEPEGALLVHCRAGVSRSTAMAMVVMTALLGPGRETLAAQLVREARPEAYPNRLIVQLADELLDRDGALVEAFRAIFH